MPVGNFTNTKNSYYSIDKESGQIKHKPKDGEPKFHNYIEGVLIGFDFEEGEYEGRPSNKYIVKFASRDGAEVDILRMGEDSNCAIDAINRLATIPAGTDYGYIRLTPYQSEFKGKFITHMSVRRNGEKLLKMFRPEEIPEATEVKVGKQSVRDLSERQEFFKKQAAIISSRLKAQAGEVGVPTDTELPPGFLDEQDNHDQEIPF